jgi:hypothetical protein
MFPESISAALHSNNSPLEVDVSAGMVVLYKAKRKGETARLEIL